MACRALERNPHANTASGLPSTSNGAATSINNSCCSMCIENNSSPSASSGETKPLKRASQPAQNIAGLQRGRPRPKADDRHNAFRPKP